MKLRFGIQKWRGVGEGSAETEARLKGSGQWWAGVGWSVLERGFAGLHGAPEEPTAHKRKTHTRLKKRREEFFFSLFFFLIRGGGMVVVLVVIRVSKLRCVTECM